MKISRTVLARILFISLFSLLSLALVWLVFQAMDGGEAGWWRISAAIIAAILIVPTGISMTLVIGSFLPEKPDQATGVAKAFHDALPPRGQEFVSGSFRIDQDSWHWKVYYWYYQQSGQLDKMPAVPNLCAYFWTVVKAQLYWFFVAPIYKWMRPWMITGVISLLVFLLAGWLWWPSVTLSFMEGLLFGASVVLLGGTVSLLFNLFLEKVLFPWIDDHDDAFGAIFYGATRFLRWLFLRHKWYVIRPITVGYVLLLAIVTALGGVTAALTMLQVTVATGLFLTIVLIAMVAIYSIPWLVNRTRKKRAQSIGEADSTKEPVLSSSIFALAYEVLFRPSHKNVCPNMHLPIEQQDG